MTRLYVVVEGQTEESFVNAVLLPVLLSHQVLATSILTGGNPRWSRVRQDVATLLHDRTAFVTTMFDLYGLGPDWPRRLPSPIHNGAVAARQIEHATAEAIASNPPRFIPHIQPFEFEALLFSEPTLLADAIGAPAVAPRLGAIRGQFQSPEEINDSPQTAPSKRILGCFPAYQKVLHGALAAQTIGLDRMRAECPHFSAWIDRLIALGTS